MPTENKLVDIKEENTIWLVRKQNLSETKKRIVIKTISILFYKNNICTYICMCVHAYGTLLVYSTLKFSPLCSWLSTAYSPIKLLEADFSQKSPYILDYMTELR